MKSDRTELFTRLQDTQAQFYAASEQLKDIRASGSQLHNLAAIADKLDRAQDMLAHVMTAKYWD